MTVGTDVWRRRSNCGRMQRDSRMSVKVYGICKSWRQYGCPKHTFDIETNVEYCSPLEGVLAHEDGSHDRSAHDGAHNAPKTRDMRKTIYSEVEM
jgi:hypothetical protein